MFQPRFGLAAALILSATALAAEDRPAESGFVLEDAYLRSATPNAKSAAAYMSLSNESGQDDRLIAVASELDGMAELHTSAEDANGVMKMMPIEGGVPIADGETHLFEQGGDHLMLMGLTAPLEDGQSVSLTLTFEKAGEVPVSIEVDQDR